MGSRVKGKTLTHIRASHKHSSRFWPCTRCTHETERALYGSAVAIQMRESPRIINLCQSPSLHAVSRGSSSTPKETTCRRRRLRYRHASLTKLLATASCLIAFDRATKLQAFAKIPYHRVINPFWQLLRLEAVHHLLATRG